VTDWVVEKELKTGAYALNDFNFETPKASLLAKSVIPRAHAAADFEVYDYPGEYEAHGDGETLAKVRIEELQSTYETLHAQATARGLCPGYLFTLQDHPREDQNREYLVTGMSCQMHAGDFGSGAASEEDEHFSCSFTCIDSQTPYRPGRTTPKPLIQGPQTAIVVGPGGDEIYTDEHARVKVQFHWDRHGKADENSSCWVRVSQSWAGKEWGSIHIPRIGQEVIIEFLEGDPDRPIITGRVYNGDQVPPYALPGNKTQSGIKSRSSTGGGGANFNEIRFEDKKGSEEIYIHAEKDQKIIVEHDKHLEVGNDKFETIKRDKTIDVGRSHMETIAKNMTVDVGSNLSESVGTNYSETVGAAMELTVGGFLNVSVGGAMTESVGGAKGEAVGGYKSETIGLDKTLDVGKNLTENVAQNQTVEIGKNLTESIQGQHQEAVKKEYMLKAKKIQLVAEDEVSIKTGDAEIIMKKNGDITIKGGKINVKGSGDVTVKGSQIKEN